MNALSIAFLWCIVQVTILSFLVGLLYLAVRRLRPAAGLPILMAGLGTIVVLTLFSASPWPRWIRHAATSPERSVAAAPMEAVSEAQGVEFIGNKFNEEITNLSQAGPTGGASWTSIIGWTISAAFGGGLVWLILSLAAVRKQRLCSRPVADKELSELVDVLRAELRCLRPVDIRQCDDLVTAATIGWRRPILLLPENWTDWTAEQRHAVLAHEIAHVRNRDFFALVCGHLGLVLHFYHPLVHWMMHRMRLEQELAADAAAASVSGGQWSYLKAIAEIALHQQDRPLPWPARTFLPTQSTFLRRIAMLRNDKMRFERGSLLSRSIAIGAVLLCGILVAGIRGPAMQTQASAEETSATAGNAANMTAEKDTSKEAASENLLSNPGMEKGEEYADDWLQGASIDGVKYSWDKNVAFEGKASLCIEKTVNRYFPIASWGQTIERKGDLPFLEVSAQVKTKKMFKATLDVIFLDKTGQSISHEWAAYIGAKKDGDPPANHNWKRYSGIVKIPEGTKTIQIELQDYGPGMVWFDDVQAKYTSSKKPAASPLQPNGKKDVIIEGVGWKDLKIGMKREKLLKALGQPDNDPKSDWLKWNKKHLECTFHTGATGVSEIRFDPGFPGALANGVKVGSPAGDVEKYYGDKPEHTINRENGAKEYEYSSKGILFWTHKEKITQIVVFEPSEKKDIPDENTPEELKVPIVEGVGWNNMKIGMKKDELLEKVGKPDDDSEPNWFKWKKKHIDCSFWQGSEGVSEIHINGGFPGALANGLKVGSPAGDVQKFYGEKPDSVKERQNGAKRCDYSSKGIIFWTYDGKISQIVIIEPTKAKPAEEEDSGKEAAE